MELYTPADGETVIYVDNAGSDAGDGSPKKPFKTIPAAYREAVNRINAGSAGHTVIYLRKGTYVLSEELTLNGNDIKVTGNHSITFRGNENLAEGATITSAVSIDGSLFQPVEGKSYYQYHLPEDAKKQTGTFPAFRDLCLDGTLLRLASTTDEYKLPYDTVTAKYILPEIQEHYTDSDHIILVHPCLLSEVATDEEGYIVNEWKQRCNLEFWVKVEWQVHCIRGVRIGNRSPYFSDPETGIAYMELEILESDWNFFKGHYCSNLQRRNYWLANQLAFLDEPGEFYYDRISGTIYVYPTDGKMENHTVSYPRLERLFYLKNAYNISFASLNITGVTCNFVTNYGFVSGQAGHIKTLVAGKAVGFLPYGAVYGEDVDNIRFRNCYFHDVGDDAVNFRGGVSNINVTGCNFENIGGSALRFGFNVPTFDDKIYNRNISVTDNEFHNLATVFPSSAGIMVASVRDLTISKNSFVNTAYSAISVGWSWTDIYEKDPLQYDTDSFVNVKNATISYNYIENFMYGMRDGGSIYTLGGNATKHVKKPLNFIYNNYMIVGRTCGDAYRGYRTIYHDLGSSHWYDHDNVILAREDVPPRDAFIIGGTANCTIENTYIVNYSLDTPKSVYDGTVEKPLPNIREINTVRNITSDDLPKEVVAIYDSCGCTADIRLPVGEYPADPKDD